MNYKIWWVLQEKFKEIIESNFPPRSEVFRIFIWLRNEAHNAISVKILNEINDARMLLEAHFSKFKYLRKDVEKASMRVKKEIRKRYEELRKVSSRKKVKLGFLEGELEEEKLPLLE